MKPFFITGMYRSGTSLLANLLGSHPQAVVASQPVPLLYAEIKKQFLLSVNSNSQYPLDHLFNETSYTNSDFTKFLSGNDFSKEFINQAMAATRNYSGQYSPELLPELLRLGGGNLALIHQNICAIAAATSDKKVVNSAGTKEIICEEFIPYFLSKDLPVIHIIRDPRDVLASANKGQKMGHVRPTLFTLRQWRKSIAFTLELAGKANYMCIRYEDLVENPEKYSDEFAGFLGLPGFEKSFLRYGITDQKGEPWKGNSAYENYSGIVTDSIGRYKQVLSEEAIKFAELFCYPEMKVLGYACNFISGEDFTEENILLQKEPFLVTHPAFKTNSSEAENKLKAEAERLQLLKSAVMPDIADQTRLFVFPKSFATIKESL